MSLTYRETAYVLININFFFNVKKKHHIGSFIKKCALGADLGSIPRFIDSAINSLAPNNHHVVNS